MKTKHTCEHGATNLLNSTQYCTPDCKLPRVKGGLGLMEQSDAKPQVEHTPTPKVTFDGCGINDTDEYASRLATFTERGRPYGEAIVRAVNSHNELISRLSVFVHRYDGISEAEMSLTYGDPSFAKNLREARELLANIAKAEGK